MHSFCACGGSGLLHILSTMTMSHARVRCSRLACVRSSQDALIAARISSPMYDEKPSKATRTAPSSLSPRASNKAAQVSERREGVFQNREAGDETDGSVNALCGKPRRGGSITKGQAYPGATGGKTPA